MNPADAVCLMHRKFWFYDCCAAERSLAPARQLLRINQSSHQERPTEPVTGRFPSKLSPVLFTKAS
ncbi:hypothetical protein C1X69_07640 [Pseudomonas sp. FW305-67]|nr:hypothetical protein C1X70_05140 [Pseudomonas sp. FW305-53]PMY88077.1 hypothetical protein C1X68_04620 [Pseudomonas sp. FW303-C2]PNA44913.1 hypothetical protein C1X71_06965 [Pseudomonas sp. FW306-2-2C-A10BC]PNA87443.1 hypothetical protein C1X66_07730 [Pseudomonas sp. MPR-R3B]PNB22111.1 hypothetical protein C1X69_07640 [Pseudomonas sp. FW305-67]